MTIRFPASITVFAVIAAGSYLLLTGLLPNSTNFAHKYSQYVPTTCQPVPTEKPDHPIELKRLVALARQNNQRITITAPEDGYQHQGCDAQVVPVNINEMNQLIDLDLGKQEVTVQTGMTWQQLQERLDIFGLSISPLPLCTHCSVGKTISTSAYGHGLGSNLMANSFLSMRVLLSDGQHLFTSPHNNDELFWAVIGSHNLIGIPTVATLKVVPNSLLNRQEEIISSETYDSYFMALSKIPNLALHTAQLTLGPFKGNTMVVNNYWDTQEPAAPRHESGSAPPDAVYIERLKESWQIPTTIRENEANEYPKRLSRSQLIAELTDTSTASRVTLKEYFIPLNQFQRMVEALQKWQKQHHRFKQIDASIRFVNADDILLTPYAAQPCFAVRLFLDGSQVIGSKAMSNTMTRHRQTTLAELDEAVLDLGGRNALTDTIDISQKQFKRIYPEFYKLVAAKKKWDQANLLTNQLEQKYLQH